MKTGPILTAAGALIAASIAAFLAIPYDVDCPDGAAYCEATFTVRGEDDERYVCDRLAMTGGTATCADAGTQHEVANVLACAKQAKAIESWECLPRQVDEDPCDVENLSHRTRSACRSFRERDGVVDAGFVPGRCDAVCSAQIPAAREDDARAVLDTFDAKTDPAERAPGAATFR